MHDVKPLAREERHRSPHRAPLATHHAGGHDPARSRRIGSETLFERPVEDDGHGRTTVTLGEAQEYLSIPIHDVRGVDDGGQTPSKAPVGRSMKLTEHLLRGCLVASVTDDRLPERI